MKDFFISYNRADREWAEWVAWQLEAAGYTTTLQAWDFRPGSNFALEMHGAASTAARTIALLSPDYLQSPFTASEWAAALAADPSAAERRLLPVRIRQCEPTGMLRAVVYLDLVGLDQEQARSTLLGGVSAERGKPASAPVFPARQQPPQPPCASDGQADDRRPLRLVLLSDLKVSASQDRPRGDLQHLEEHLGARTNTDGRPDAIVIAGDITRSGRSEEFEQANVVARRLLRAAAVPSDRCFLTPGNHDVDWSAIGVGDSVIVSQLETEEGVARVLSDPRAMAFLSRRLDAFYQFTQLLLGKARGWSPERPWNSEQIEINGTRIGFGSMNGVWSSTPAHPSKTLGLYQLLDLVDQLRECVVRFWVSHDPPLLMGRDPVHRVAEALAPLNGMDIFLHGHLHDGSGAGQIANRWARGPILSVHAHSGGAAHSWGYVEVTVEANRAQVSLRHWHWDPRSESFKVSRPQEVSLAPRGRIPSQPGAGQVLHGPSPEGRAELRGSRANATPTRATEHKPRPEAQPRRAQRARPNEVIRTVSDAVFRERAVDQTVLVVTAASVELGAVLDELKPLKAERRIWRTHVGQETYYLGRLGRCDVVVTLCAPGAIGRDSVILASHQAIDIFQPQAIIMVGVAFGLRPEGQEIGDVLVSSQVISYEQQRVGVARTIHRGPVAESGPILLNRFRQVLDWHFRLPGRRYSQLLIGPILSGEKLVDELEFRDRLSSAYPQAIGGEMEGAGLYATADRARVEWIVVKGICDWADGKKSDSFQATAAAAAVSVVCHVLSEPGVIRPLLSRPALGVAPGTKRTAGATVKDGRPGPDA